MEESFRELQEKVVLWAKSKGISLNTVSRGQILKFAEESAELVVDASHLRAEHHSVYGDNIPEYEAKTRDAIGDVLVTIIILSHQMGIDPIACLSEAYDVIKGRTGTMKNGQFVRDE